MKLGPSLVKLVGIFEVLRSFRVFGWKNLGRYLDMK